MACRTARREMPSTPESHRLVTCGLDTCRRLFSVCRRCDFGRAYCSRECANTARRLRQRAASRCYQMSERGRRAHAERQARYRQRRARVTHRSLPEAPQSPPASPTELCVGADERSTQEALPTPWRSRPALGDGIAESDPAVASVLLCIACGDPAEFLRNFPLQRRHARTSKRTSLARTLSACSQVRRGAGTRRLGRCSQSPAHPDNQLSAPPCVCAPS